VFVAGRRTTRPSHQFNHLAARLHTYLRAVLDGFAGEATLRDFTGTEWHGVAGVLVLAGVVAVLIAAWPRRDASPLARFAACYLVVALVGMPAVLAPVRNWNLPAADAQRYLFAVLAPFVLLVGALAEGARGRWVAGALALYLLAVPTARAAHFFLAGGSTDHGAYTLLGGGGYRGWKVARQRAPLPELIHDEVDRLAGARPAMIVMADYAFHPLHFANLARHGNHWPHDVAKAPLPVQHGWLHVFVLWSDGVFGRGFHPRDWVRLNDQLRARMHSDDYTGLRFVRRFVQPDGEPLLELWAATRR
jgi:hypothetical protein